MKTWFARLKWPAASLGFFHLFTVAVFAEVKVEEQIVGPALDLQGSDRLSTYTISPSGVHLATVTHKGSRWVVILDGVAGPKFDEIIPALGYIDPRPYQNMDINLVPRSQPVTFSKDGKRFAYVARQGQDWELVADNKELVRLPADTS